MDKASLGKLLLAVAYLEGDFVLRSGRRSRYYLDKYLFETEPRVLRGIVHEMALMLRNRMAAGAVYQRIAAPETGRGLAGGRVCLWSRVYPFSSCERARRTTVRRMP